MTAGLSKPISALDLPAPSWLKAKPELASSWGRMLISATRLGRIECYARGQVLRTAPHDLLLVLKGCVLATAAPQASEGPQLFMGALRRGDIITPTISRQIPLSLQVKSATTALFVPEHAIQEFITEVGVLDQLFLALEFELARVYATAASSAFLRDQARILRVISILAGHPEAVSTPVGLEIEASKEEIRTLAGVSQRSSTRAFRSLKQEGVVSFNGYKRVYYSGPLE